MQSGSSWRFDPRTAVVVVVLLPLFYYLLRVVLRYLKEWGGYALEGGLYWVGRALKHSLAASLSVKRYSRLILNGPNQHLHVPAGRGVTVRTDEAYVPLTLAHGGDAGGTYTHESVLGLGNRIRVIGDPGSGKSTLVKRLVRDACQDAINRPRAARLPLLFELRGLEVPGEVAGDGACDWLFEKLRGQVAQTAVYRMDECFDNYARTTGVLVLLDGLDEVSGAAYPRAQAAILGLSRRLGGLGDHNVIVLTMRTQFHQQIEGAYETEFPNVAVLKPFSPSDIHDFLMRWPFARERERHIARIYNDLGDRPTLREMCSNPLVLAMYVAEDQAAGHSIAPDSRTEFYSKVTEELMIRRRLRQTAPPMARTKLKEQRERILGALAYEHLLDPNQPANLLGWSEAVRVVAQVTGCTEADAELRFRELAKETGLVTEERVGESFRFIHLTFCEFVAAKEAVQGREEGWANLVDTHRKLAAESEPQLRARLVEVLPFACGLLARRDRPAALGDLVELGDPGLVARGFLETKLYDHVSWPSFVLGEREALTVRPEAEWDDAWLRRLHLFNVVVRDAQQCAEHMPVSPATVDLEGFYGQLIATQRDSLHKILAAYARQDAAAAFRVAEVCGLDIAQALPELVVDNCDQRPFFALVRARAAEQLEWVGVWASLLAEGALRSRAVLGWMWREPPMEQWARYIAEIPARRRWWQPGFLSRTFFSECLTLALGPRGAASGAHPLLDAVRRVTPPGGLRLAGRWWFFGTAALVPLAVGLPSVLAGWPAGAAVSGACLGVGLSYWLLLRRLTLRIAYWRLFVGDDAGPDLGLLGLLARLIAPRRAARDLRRSYPARPPVLARWIVSAVIGRELLEAVATVRKLRSHRAEVGKQAPGAG